MGSFGELLAARAVLQIAAGKRYFLAALLAPPEEAASAGEEDHQSLALGAFLVGIHEQPPDSLTSGKVYLPPN
jgi:hypothetical protein